MKVVFDTNVIVSYFLSPTGIPANLLTRWEQGTVPFAVIVSEAILTEYAQALAYPHVQDSHKRTDQEIEEYIALFRNLALLVSPTEAITIVKDDPADNNPRFALVHQAR